MLTATIQLQPNLYLLRSKGVESGHRGTMDAFQSIGWILLYVFVIALVPSVVVLLATFLTGLGFFIRDLKYDISKKLKKKAAEP